jgi:hypothetical protein
VSKPPMRHWGGAAATAHRTRWQAGKQAGWLADAALRRGGAVFARNPLGHDSCVLLPPPRHGRCIFRKDSIEDTLRATHGVCPVCKENYPGLRRGTQGSGTMATTLDANADCAGSPKGSGTLCINYNFPGGVQSARMAKPGQPYSGDTRSGYYPNTQDGRRAVRMLKVAFKQGVLFNVGFSPTQGGAASVAPCNLSI